jgi:hypothetical protein
VLKKSSKSSGILLFLFSAKKCLVGIFGQELDLELHSFFDGQIHKNKVWSGIVEGMLPISHTHALSFVSPSVVFSMSGTHT